VNSWFEDETDDYRDDYAVYRLSDSDLLAFQEVGWGFLENRALMHLGDVPVPGVSFDSTRRKELDASILDGFNGDSVEESLRPKS
jgi:hypothetical protein